MKITASFATVDEAENCARRLKHTCGGIYAIRIRYHAIDDEENTPIPAPMSLNSPGNTNSAFFALELGPLKEEPHRRRDCVMDIIAESMYHREIEAVLLNEHGTRLRTQE